MGLHKNDEDFGQTLGAWGLGSGPYAVLPLLGPSTVRDAVGRVSVSFLEPYPHLDHVPILTVTRCVDLIDTSAGLTSAEQMIQGDRYIFVLNYLLQHSDLWCNEREVEDEV